MRTIERQLQQNLDNIQKWAIENGFKFSKSKTQCVHFCRLQKHHDNPELYISGSKIPAVDEAKFLGIIFDKKLSFIPHIKHLKTKCLKVLNLLKRLSSTNWGSNTSTLLKLYRSLIRSKLDYGSVVYGSARKSPGFTFSFRCFTCRKSICGSWGTIASSSSNKAITSICN
jgi:hypothetical protein